MLEPNELDTMKRKELQKLCKERGIKANSKTSQLIENLKAWCAENGNVDEANGETGKDKEQSCAISETKDRSSLENGEEEEEENACDKEDGRDALPSKDDLEVMPRKELQMLCKKYGIKANSKTAKLVANLCDYYASMSSACEADEQKVVKTKTKSSPKKKKKRKICRALANLADSLQPGARDAAPSVVSKVSLTKDSVSIVAAQGNVETAEEEQEELEKKTTPKKKSTKKRLSRALASLADTLSPGSRDPAPQRDITTNGVKISQKKRRLSRAVANLADSLTSGALDPAPSSVSSTDVDIVVSTDISTSEIATRKNLRARLSNSSVSTVPRSTSSASQQDSTIKKDQPTKRRRSSRLERLSEVKSDTSIDKATFNEDDDEDDVLVEHTFGGLSTVKKKTKKKRSARVSRAQPLHHTHDTALGEMEPEISVPKRRRSARLSDSEKAPAKDSVHLKYSKKKRKIDKKKKRRRAVPDWNKIHGTMFKDQESIATTYQKIQARRTPKPVKTKRKSVASKGKKKRISAFRGGVKSKTTKTAAPKSYGNKKKRRRSRNPALDIGSTAFDEVAEAAEGGKKSRDKAKRRAIYVAALKRKPFVAKKANRKPIETREFNLSTSNFGTRRGSKAPVKPTWKMKTKPFKYDGDSMFSPQKPTRGRKTGFDLEHSLAMPLTWEPHKGPIRG
eukprot:g652.t1